jgi:uncharacterized protein (DUF433 family)
MMTLPDFLAADDGGFIHIANHRIGLHHLVRLYVEGYSPEMIAESFPSLPLSLIHKTIAFYLDNRADVDQYIAMEEQATAAQIAAAPPTPSIAELRKHLHES